MENKRKRDRLRHGFTTGTCAAAVAKAATLSLLSEKCNKEISLKLPLGKTIILPLSRCQLFNGMASVSIIKDAGDDPDVTNGAEIVAQAAFQPTEKTAGLFTALQFENCKTRVSVYAGQGIGLVTKPGLAIKPGHPAINPVPGKMIESAVRDILSGIDYQSKELFITISVPRGVEIAKKTMNERLGIMGGISILGTTGIVRPLSLSAYRDSIACAINVAIASGCPEIVFSTGRSSERSAQTVLNLDEESFILVGDHMGFALRYLARLSSKKQVVKKACVTGQFGKFSKLAAGHFETHYTDSNIDIEFLAKLAGEEGASREVINKITNANSARHIKRILEENNLEGTLDSLCREVRKNVMKIVPDLNVGCVLAGYDTEPPIIAGWVGDI